LPDEELLKNVRIELVGKADFNSGITAFAARRSLTNPGDCQLLVKIEHNLPHAARGQLTIWRNNQMLDVVEWSAEPNVPWQKTWHLQGADRQIFRAELQSVEKDCFAADNQAQTSVNELKSVRVILMSPPNLFFGDRPACVAVGGIDARVACACNTGNQAGFADLHGYYCATKD
jgi:hypothetical protein